MISAQLEFMGRVTSEADPLARTKSSLLVMGLDFVAPEMLFGASRRVDGRGEQIGVVNRRRLLATFD